MFHPDNVKNYHPKGNKVSHSIYDLWNTYGGNKGLAHKLRTDLKVPLISYHYTFLIMLFIERYSWE